MTMNDNFKSFSTHLMTSLSETWASFVKHIPTLLLAVLVITIGIFLSLKLTDYFRRAISSKIQDQIMANFLAKSIKLLMITLFIMYALDVAGFDGIAGGILAAAGASTIILGFAFKDIGENFISGIILSFNRPFNVNETVLIGEVFGKVKNIEFRYTKLRTFDGRDVYIPNSDVIKNPVYNYTEDGFFRFDFLVGIAYENDIGAAEKLIMERLRSIDCVFEDEAHPNFVIADSLDVSTVNLKVHFWVETHEYGREALLKKGQVVSDIKSALLEEGFSLPASISEIKLYDTQESIPLSGQNLAALSTINHRENRTHEH
jgi:small conductance mechanosensitive channel